MREVDRQTAAVTGASNCIGEAMAQWLARALARAASRRLTMGGSDRVNHFGKPTTSVRLGDPDADSAVRARCVAGLGKMPYSQGEQPKVNLNLSAYNWRSPMASAFGQKTSI